MSASPAPPPRPGSSADGAKRKHATSAVDLQRAQLDKLLKDPSKPAFVPAAPKEKTIRPAREMMKNVQGSSAGAGSGEFHVYKASRRREYERLKMMEEQSQKELMDAEFERKRKEAEEQAEAKTSKNRAKRQKKKERAKNKDRDNKASSKDASRSDGDTPIKKRRLVNGKELVFKAPGEVDSEEEDASDADDPQPVEQTREALPNIEREIEPAPGVVNEPRIIIHEDD